MHIGIAGQHREIAVHFAFGGFERRPVAAHQLRHFRLFENTHAKPECGPCQTMGVLERMQMAAIGIDKGPEITFVGHDRLKLLAVPPLQRVIEVFSQIVLPVFQLGDVPRLDRHMRVHVVPVAVDAVLHAALFDQIKAFQRPVEQTPGIAQPDRLGDFALIAAKTENSLPAAAP